MSRSAAALSGCGRFVEMRRGGWSGRFPVADLDGWIAFYRRLRDRDCKRTARTAPWAAIYAPDVAALEAVRADIAGRAR